jgi:hypothetical protein
MTKCQFNFNGLYIRLALKIVIITQWKDINSATEPLLQVPLNLNMVAFSLA